MKRTSLFLPFALLIMQSLNISDISAEELPLPEFHSEVTLQSEMYFGDDDTISGYLVPDNKFVIRHAVIEAVGKLGNYIEYDMEIGSATCVGAGNQILLMEAGLFIKPLDFLKAGIMKGHIMRGFELHDECVHLITAEKPRFSFTFSPCHPTGLVIETDYDFTDAMGISAQLAYLDGATGTFDDEHDINLGLTFRTPIEGLSFGGFYTDWQQDFEFDGEPDNGLRTGFGFDMNKFDAHLRGEYYLGKGFYSNYENVSSKDLEMNAFYIEGAYMVKTGSNILPYVQPYVMYQSWDKASNVDGDYVYSYLTTGMSFGLGEYDAKLRIEYETPISAPDDAPEEARKLVIRIQGGI